MIGHVYGIAEIVAVKSNVHFAVMNQVSRYKLTQCPYYFIGQVNSTGLQTYEHCIGQVGMVFQDLVTKPFDSDGQLLLIQYCLQKGKF
jgi:hypothetical protein